MKYLSLALLLLLIGSSKVATGAGDSLADLPFNQVTGGAPMLGEKAALRIRFFEPPLLLTGNQFEKAPAGDWADSFTKLRQACDLTYDSYKNLVTLAFLAMTGYLSQAKFDDDMAKLRAALKSQPPLKSSLLWVIELNSTAGDYLYIVEAGGTHLSYAEAANGIPSNLASLSLFKRENQVWKAESFDALSKQGLKVVPWNTQDKLKALQKARAIAVGADGKLGAAEGK